MIYKGKNIFCQKQKKGSLEAAATEVGEDRTKSRSSGPRGPIGGILPVLWSLREDDNMINKSKQNTKFSSKRRHSKMAFKL